MYFGLVHLFLKYNNIALQIAQHAKVHTSNSIEILKSNENRNRNVQ